jgi:hypothetical protein
MTKKTSVKHPLQPVVEDAQGTKRFKANDVVQYLLDHGGMDMNDLARLHFSNEDREQFAQLIGYSLSGFAELSYVSDEAVEAAQAMAEDPGKTDLRARCEALRGQLSEIQELLKGGVARLYGIHPDDLKGQHP